MENVQNDEAQFIKMTTAPIPKLIISLAIPTIITMLITSIYNMADTFFVSKLGTSASGAVGIVFSIMAIIQAIGFTLGLGSGAQVSRLLGQHKKKEADVISSTGFFTAISLGLLLTILGLVFIKPLMYLLGATDTILPYALDYAKYIILGSSIMCGSFVLNNLLRSEGQAMFSMIGIGTGGIINMFLDPIFIFKLNLGISGAAIATLVSQCISFIILLSCFLRGKSITTIHIKYVSKNITTLISILKTGLPSFCRQGLASISTVALNLNAAVYGDAAVAAMSIVGRIFMFILSAMIGFGQGFQPVVGYNYGAKKYKRVKSAFCFSLKIGTIFLTLMSVIGLIIAPHAIAIFRKSDPVVIAIGTIAFRAQCLSLPLQPVIVLSNMMFQSIGKSLEATFISASRQGIFFIPLIIILPKIFNLSGIQFTQTIADFLTFLCCFPFLIKFFKELNATIAKENFQKTIS